MGTPKSVRNSTAKREQISIFPLFRPTCIEFDDRDDGHDYSIHRRLSFAMSELTVYPASKLGEYTVIQDIAEGTFGKVKSTSCKICLISALDQLMLYSGHTHYNRSESCHEVYLKGSHPYDQDQDSCPEGGRVHANATTPTYHKTVCHYPLNHPYSSI